MIRQWLQMLLVLGLLLPGVAPVGADVAPDVETQQPCGDAGSAPDEGGCCGDDGAMSAACAAHCLATAAPRTLFLPATPPARIMHAPPPDGAIPNPSYAPSLPPPIA